MVVYHFSLLQGPQKIFGGPHFGHVCTIALKIIGCCYYLVNVGSQRDHNKRVPLYSSVILKLNLHTLFIPDLEYHPLVELLWYYFYPTVCWIATIGKGSWAWTATDHDRHVTFLTNCRYAPGNITFTCRSELALI